MALLGGDFRGGLFRQRFAGHSPAGLGLGLLTFAALLGGYLLLQGALAVLMQVLVFRAAPGDGDTLPLAAIIGLLPMALLMVPVAWQAARIRGGNPLVVLNLRWPDLTGLGWVAVVAGFMLGVMVLFTVVISAVMAFGGEPPQGGLVENTVSGIAGNTAALVLVVPALIIGAPVAEELLFRGQIYTALAQSRAGFSGATVLTAAAWSVLHFSGSYLQVAMIFLMGLLLGWLLYRFGSLLLTIACHAAWNAVVSMALLGSGGVPA